MIPPRFLIVGSGRCGTGFAAKALTLMGLPCGHEAVYDWNESTSGTEDRWDGLAGDSSLAAGGYLDDVPSDWPIVLLVRDPLAVVASWLGNRFFADSCPPSCGHDPGEHLATPYVQWMNRTYPGIFDGADDELGRAIAWTARWNHLLRYCADRVLLVEQIDADTLAGLVDDLGGSGDLERARQVIDALGTDTNRHPRRPLLWDTVDAHPLALELHQHADRFGYPHPGGRQC